jgi:hypothetical protein
VVSAVLRKFHLTSATPFMETDIPVLAEVVLRPKNGLKIMLSARI